MACDLCKREKRTRQHYDDETVWVVDCQQCNVPMLVLKRHTKTPTKEEKARIMKLAKVLFPYRRYDDGMRSIPDHYHAHMR